MLQPSLCNSVFLTWDPTHYQGVFQGTIIKIFLKNKPELKVYCLQTTVSILPTSLTLMRLYFAFTFQENIALTFTGNASAFDSIPLGIADPR